MYNRDKSGLLIFDNFQIDFLLPKWRSRVKVVGGTDDLNPFPPSVPFTRFNSRRGNMVTGGLGFMPIPSNGIIGVTASSDKPKSPSFFERIFHRKRLKQLEEKKRQELNDAMMQPNFTIEEIKEPTEEISVEEFFTGIKGTAEQLQLATDRFKNYESAIEHLKKTGQIALLEMMEHQLEIHSAETKLYALGFRKVVTEENIIQFASKSSKDLCMDWIKNFARSIPPKAVDAKMIADENLIFDNYVILHCDPLKDGKMLTVQEEVVEEQKKKDPILFGVIAGSNKLYYLASWIDEFCDLTFDKIIEKLGEKAISANDLTVEVQQVID